MKTAYYYAAAAAAILLTAQACSDNINPELEPVKTERTLDVTVGGAKVSRLDLNAAPSETTVEVTSNTRWTVEISNCEGGWCSVDVINGSGDGSFTITVLDNMRDVRDCDVTVYMTDAEGNKDTKDSWTIKVQQEVSDVRITPSSLEPFAAQNPRAQDFSIVSNVEWTLSVSYEGENATEFVTIIPKEGMTDRGDGTFSGNAGASFMISLQDNRTTADRKAYLNLVSSVSHYIVEVTQSRSEYAFDVTPSENRVVAAEGGDIRFGVLSIVGWDVKSSADWISFSVPSMAEGSDSRVETVARIAPNSEGVRRETQIQFQPKDDRYPMLTVTVTQLGYDMAFGISRADTVGVVMEGGADLRLELDSRFRWTAEAPSWLRVNPGEGNASSSLQKIAVEVDANQTNQNRTGNVRFTPMPTEFSGGVTLDPAKLGIEPLSLSVTQYGGREAAISVPWLRDGYTKTSAIVEFNFYSPFHEIVEAGLEWGRADSAQRSTMTVTPSDGTDATVSFELSGLDAATRYVARGYVKDARGNVKYGAESFPFTTAGQYPGENDNPAPGLN